MNNDQVEGRTDSVKGKMKEVAGRVTGNERLEGEGLADQTSGKVQANYGDAKEDVKDGIKRTVDKL